MYDFKKPNDQKGFPRVIAKANATLLVLASQSGEPVGAKVPPLATGRAWCLFEFAKTVQLRNHEAIQPTLAPQDELAFQYELQTNGAAAIEAAFVRKIDCEKADAFSKEDLNNIKNMVRDHLPGGFDSVNVSVRAGLREWLCASAERALARLEGGGTSASEGLELATAGGVGQWLAQSPLIAEAVTVLGLVLCLAALTLFVAAVCTDPWEWGASILLKLVFFGLDALWPCFFLNRYIRSLQRQCLGAAPGSLLASGYYTWGRAQICCTMRLSGGGFSCLAVLGCMGILIWVHLRLSSVTPALFSGWDAFAPAWGFFAIMFIGLIHDGFCVAVRRDALAYVELLRSTSLLWLHAENYDAAMTRLSQAQLFLADVSSGHWAAGLLTAMVEAELLAAKVRSRLCGRSATAARVRSRTSGRPAHWVATQEEEDAADEILHSLSEPPTGFDTAIWRFWFGDIACTYEQWTENVLLCRAIVHAAVFREAQCAAMLEERRRNTGRISDGYSVDGHPILSEVISAWNSGGPGASGVPGSGRGSGSAHGWNHARNTSYAYTVNVRHPSPPRGPPPTMGHYVHGHQPPPPPPPIPPPPPPPPPPQSPPSSAIAEVSEPPPPPPHVVEDVPLVDWKTRVRFVVAVLAYIGVVVEAQVLRAPTEICTIFAGVWCFLVFALALQIIIGLPSYTSAGPDAMKGWLYGALCGFVIAALLAYAFTFSADPTHCSYCEYGTSPCG